MYLFSDINMTIGRIIS